MSVEKAKTLYEKKDYAKALKLFEKAAKKEKDPYAAYMAGFMYYYGQGTAKNYEMARAFFNGSSFHEIYVEASKTYPDASYHVGLIFKSENVAIGSFNNFNFAAKRGHAKAQYEVALMYAVNTPGIGSEQVPKDLTEAAAWMGKAAAQGHEGAKKWLAENSGAAKKAAQDKQAQIANADVISWEYSQGENGRPKDLQKAFEWAKIGAENGNVECMYRLGASYLLGQGVKQSNVETLKWWKKAADLGNTTAAERLNELLSEMEKTLGKEGVKSMMKSLHNY